MRASRQSLASRGETVLAKLGTLACLAMPSISVRCSAGSTLKVGANWVDAFAANGGRSSSASDGASSGFSRPSVLGVHRQAPIQCREETVAAGGCRGARPVGIVRVSPARNGPARRAV